ncbi:MAG: hypothetical protein Q4E54_03145 [Lachnospiraceae bacterium]|nr:hypothetical protein [Lachnospiraceae bacterium]
MKKVVSLILVVVMVISISMVSFACPSKSSPSKTCPAWGKAPAVTKVISCIYTKAVAGTWVIAGEVAKTLTCVKPQPVKKTTPVIKPQPAKKICTPVVKPTSKAGKVVGTLTAKSGFTKLVKK